MNIISFGYGQHSCGVSVLKDGVPVYCYEEERFVRIKTSTDFKNEIFRYPLLSISELVYKNHIDINNFDAYLVADTDFFDIRISELKSCINNVVSAKGDGSVFDSNNFDKKLIKYEHHDSHCALAYYTSGFVDDKCLIISMDGLGNGYSGKYYVGYNGKMEYIDGLNLSRNSLGLYYAMLTEFLGFQRLKDEGKVVGMSSHGQYDKVLYNIFKKAIGEVEGVYTGKSVLDNDCGVFHKFYDEFFKAYGSEFYKTPKKLNDIAYNGQLVFEDTVCEIIENLHKMYPEYTKICCSGGIFANVKLNKRIRELNWVEDVYITPPMGDEGLPLGSSLLYNSGIGEQRVFKLNDVYFGNEFNYDEVRYTHSRFDKIQVEDLNIDKVVKLLADGHIIGLFQGRMEHGPRALGNRTILADASKSNTYKKLNDRLKRNDCMPFAPAVLADYADEVFKIEKGRYTAEFMTMLYDTYDFWHDKIPAAIHPIDKTARIQLVYEEKNKLLYDILYKFYLKTEIPLLINTSFNVHEEPIVCWPENALNHLNNGIVDYCIINNQLFFKKSEIPN